MFFTGTRFGVVQSFLAGAKRNPGAARRRGRRGRRIEMEELLWSLKTESKDAQPDRRELNWAAANAVVSGRCASVPEALKFAAFRGADPKETAEVIKNLRTTPGGVQAAKSAEHLRVEMILADFLAMPDADDIRSCRDDVAWRFEACRRLLKLGTSVLELDDKDLRGWTFTFELASYDDRRYFCYKFMFQTFNLLPKAQSGRVSGGSQLQSVAEKIFGEDAAYTIRHMREQVGKMIAEPPAMGRPRSLDPSLEEDLFKFVAKLRELKYPVYRSVVISYLQVADDS